MTARWNANESHWEGPLKRPAGDLLDDFRRGVLYKVLSESHQGSGDCSHCTRSLGARANGDGLNTGARPSHRPGCDRKSVSEVLFLEIREFLNLVVAWRHQRLTLTL